MRSGTPVHNHGRRFDQTNLLPMAEVSFPRELQPSEIQRKEASASRERRDAMHVQMKLENVNNCSCNHFAWVGSLAIALSMTFSPVAAKLIDRFGHRLVSLAGGVFAALGLFITSQVNTIAMMYLTYSVIFGFGSSCVFTPAYTVVPGHFTKWQSTAMGLMGSSNGLSLAMSMLIKTLLSNYGWRVTFMAMGGFALADAVIGGVFFVSNTREHKSQPSKDQVPINSSGDVPLWKNKHILVCAFASFLFQFGNTIPLVHLGRYVQDVGLSSTQAAWLYIGFGVSSTVGRLGGGRLGDVMPLYTVYIYGLSCLFAGLSTIVASFTTSFAVLMVCYCANGLAEGHYVSCGNIIIVRACSGRKIARAFGFFFGVISLGYAGGPPFAGWLADLLGSYVPVLQIAGAITCSGTLVISSLKCMKSPVTTADLGERGTQVNDHNLSYITTGKTHGQELQVVGQSFLGLQT